MDDEAVMVTDTGALSPPPHRRPRHLRRFANRIAAQYDDDDSPIRWTNRPKWEPKVHRSAKFIQEHPSAEADAMDSLLLQGCQSPPDHFQPAHQCRVPERRLQCLREIHRWRQNRHVVELMANKLPKEIVVIILEYMAQQTQLHLHLDHRRSLPTAARSIIGDSPIIDKLQPFAEEAILNTSIISLNVALKGDRGGKVAVLDPFVAKLPRPIRHFQLHLSTQLPFWRMQYPGTLYGATAGMASLLSQLPSLRSFHLLLSISLSQHPGDNSRAGVTPEILNFACRKGFSGTSTFKQVIVDLLDAARVKGNSGPGVSLELRYEHPDRWRPPWKSSQEVSDVVAGDRPAVDVVEEADAQHEW